jgi:hypothetical protein
MAENPRGVPMERMRYYALFYQPDIPQLADEKRLKLFSVGSTLSVENEKIKSFTSVGTFGDVE